MPFKPTVSPSRTLPTATKRKLKRRRSAERERESPEAEAAGHRLPCSWWSEAALRSTGDFLSLESQWLNSTFILFFTLFSNKICYNLTWLKKLYIGGFDRVCFCVCWCLFSWLKMFWPPTQVGHLLSKLTSTLSSKVNHPTYSLSLSLGRWAKNCKLPFGRWKMDSLSLSFLSN